MQIWNHWGDDDECWIVYNNNNSNNNNKKICKTVKTNTTKGGKLFLQWNYFISWYCFRHDFSFNFYNNKKDLLCYSLFFKNILFVFFYLSLSLEYYYKVETVMCVFHSLNANTKGKYVTHSKEKYQKNPHLI